MLRLTLALLAGLLAATPAFGQTFAWNLTGSGAWSSNASWDPNTGVPNGPTHEALFDDGITTTATADLSSSVTLNRLTFDGITGTKAYSVLGGATITLGGAGAALRVTNTVSLDRLPDGRRQRPGHRERGGGRRPAHPRRQRVHVRRIGQRERRHPADPPERPERPPAG